ncbi:MAG: hypothetical protein JOZ52_10435 [Acidobacteria bacterium]|nr:hypothetical protein [Acidobacteriota bacterium]
MKIKLYCRIVLLVVVASLLCVTALAQDEEEARSPLELKLTTRTTAFCVGSPMMFEMEVTNNGQKDVAINKAQLWSEFSYTSLNPGRRMAGAWGRQFDNRGGQLILQPGDSYHTEYELELPADFFRAAGHYSIKTMMDHIFSNEIEFELYDCGKPQEVKEQ